MKGDGVIENIAVRDENGNPVTGEHGTYIQDNDAGGTVKTDEEIQQSISDNTQTEYSPESDVIRENEINNNPSGVSDIAEETGITSAPVTEAPDLANEGSREASESNYDDRSGEELASRVAELLGNK